MTPYLTIFAAATENAMIALSTAVRGDAAIRADKSAVFILAVAGGYATAANWKQIPGLSHLVAGTADTRTAAVLLATLDVDAAMRYQGRRYDLTQEREFPRLAYSLAYAGLGRLPTWSPREYVSAVVWDLDSAGNVIVPESVFLAVLHQADSILAADRDERLQAIRDGLTSQKIGSLAETYSEAVVARGAPVLCARAEQFMNQYRLVSGPNL